jgi:hypothetical protein
VLVPVLTLVLGGLCIYSTIFSNVMRDLLVRGADRTSYDNFYTITGWGVAFVIAIMFLSLLFLVLHGIDTFLTYRRRKPFVCERCGAVDRPGNLPFKREPIDDTTDVDKITCPLCGHYWFTRG